MEKNAYILGSGPLYSHAKRELDILCTKDSRFSKFRDVILEVVKLFKVKGLNDGDLFFVMELLGKIISYENLSDLTLGVEEWSLDRNEFGVIYNIRNKRVMRSVDGRVFYLSFMFVDVRTKESFIGVVDDVSSFVWYDRSKGLIDFKFVPVVQSGGSYKLVSGFSDFIKSKVSFLSEEDILNVGIKLNK